ncbi:hypothetical protein GUITHDRAFT_149785 [Guillardia theta CCMP2712]|uniref:Uncharacterized protein n=2 Tax=Guillardia theta TaxID=55529 RepID=L1K494_GUITC|nr:hypothetical protein GUITHDRAFT_149785 [Guillardia theta CCMP2712]EKX55397.1 hypothetical protein GUITHDRAFT_149785 [Guillardia theta CCMP2712]|mmetsp:Transcript_751/g.2238  ORF Transcript_751/g.2238 Transcript_751/m.2238 type:complete len:129 (+) Transcript_751:127-513(+)|eukprot:XP_005842377.1 hypothetical protein GUITHDRAFT_149785 [Guillardia theta CCMP2712]
MSNILALASDPVPPDELQGGLSWQHVLFPVGRSPSPTSSSKSVGDGESDCSTESSSEDTDDEDQVRERGRGLADGIQLDVIEPRWISLPTCFILEPRPRSLAIRIQGREDMLLRSLQEAVSRYGRVRG